MGGVVRSESTDEFSKWFLDDQIMSCIGREERDEEKLWDVKHLISLGSILSVWRKL